MAENKNLNIYFGDTTFSLAEINKKDIVNSITAPYDSFDPTKNITTATPADEAKIAGTIQKILSDKQIETTEISLVLPNPEIILRSFIIPWMSSSELKGVVEFEVKRYIPFKLDELIYGYHSITISETKSKRIQILFIGIRTEALEKYCRIIEQAGLRVTFIEPSVLSLMRLLIFKKVINLKEKVAILQLINNEGTIIIENQGIPLFVRDFRLPVSLKDPGLANEAMVNLLKEVRISLDYYYRQHKQSGVDRLLILSDESTEALAQTLNKETEIPAVPFMLSNLINQNLNNDIGLTNTYGLGLKRQVNYPINIDLAKSRAMASQPQETFAEAPVNYLMSIKYTVVCAVILLITFLVCNATIAGYSQKASSLKAELGPYESSTVEDIQKKLTEAQDKIESLKAVRLRSNVAFFLNQIPELLPQGIWLTNLRISYADIQNSGRKSSETNKKSGSKNSELQNAKISLEISGYAFSDEVSDQIKLVNRLVENLSIDKNFSKTFRNINLSSANQRTLEEYTVTQFQVNCE